MAKRQKIDWGSLTKTIVEGDNKKSYDNDGTAEFKPKLKEDGTYNGIIRFLEPPTGEMLPFAKIYNHGFKSANNKWFIENCPTTNGGDCPVCTENQRIWDSDEDTARDRGRKLSYWFNIMVVKDPETPENEGKVFKYRCGKKIYDKIKEEMNDGQTVFDYETGSNFKLKIKKVKSGNRSYPNYDSATFSDPSPIGINGKELTANEIDDVHAQLHPLEPIVAKSEFKSYTELATSFSSKTGILVATTAGGDVVRVQETAQTTQQTEVLKDDIEEDGESDSDFFKALQS